MGKLIIARHHESEWNKQGVWTGSRDVHLTPLGFEQSARMGTRLIDTPIDYAFASMQVRTIETLSCMLEALNLHSVPTRHEAALNERDYGDYTGKNKHQMRAEFGEELFNHIHRDWDFPIPGGETLKKVYERIVPFYENEILPLLADGKNVLVVSHGNALRALMIYIESIPEKDVAALEMLFGAVIIYTVDAEGHALSKEVRTTEALAHT